MVRNFIESMIIRYGNAAAGMVEAGRRPAVLPCEQQLGTQCSAQFLQVMNESSVAGAVNDLTKRCPKGGQHAMKALGWSTIFALSPFGASTEPCGGGDPCLPGDPTAADPCGGGDPLSREIANCDC